MQCLHLLPGSQSRSPVPGGGLAAVVLHDQSFVERRGFDFIASPQVENLAAERTGVDRHPVGYASRLQYFAIVREIGATPAPRTHGNYVAGLDKERGNIGLAIVDHEMSMAHQLPGLPPRISKSHAIDDVVKTGFENLQEVVTGHATAPLGLYEVLVKLTLHDPVEPADLLLLAQLKPELGRAPGSSLSMLPGRKILGRLPLHDWAFRPIATRTLQIELHSLAPAQPADGSRVSRHCLISPPSPSPYTRSHAHRGSGPARSRP